MEEEIMQAGVFKTHCLRIIDRVKKTGKGIVITKKGKPVAQIIPFEEEQVHLFGKMEGTVQILGDIVHFTGDYWNADS